MLFIRFAARLQREHQSCRCGGGDLHEVAAVHFDDVHVTPPPPDPEPPWRRRTPYRVGGPSLRSGSATPLLRDESRGGCACTCRSDRDCRPSHRRSARQSASSFSSAAGG